MMDSQAVANGGTLRRWLCFPNRGRKPNRAGV